MWKYILLILSPTAFDPTLYNSIEYSDIDRDRANELIEFYSQDTSCIITIDSINISDLNYN